MAPSDPGPSTWSEPAQGSSDAHDNQLSQSYVCPTCGKAYEKAHILRKHLKTHNPSIPCPASKPAAPCTFTTAERRDMNRHLWVAHSKWFTRRDNLVRHLNEGRCRPAGEEEDEGEEE
ncbi:hypothetical protein NKR19_g2968 [Coniochaeta hoffmannii]|uniref:C2H2-type domain-containing protein n=1 Tax=Coniochaeta hoffmannii TaxID=91930 RepID=A0AA38VMK4_9PEZI|nr:hypothetical protein NKR19_g2968 [Coniochaeta hoffmannii]